MHLHLSADDALMIGIDLSGSMNAPDYQDAAADAAIGMIGRISRLDYAKRRARMLIADAEAHGVLVDVVGFGTKLHPMNQLTLARAEQRLPELVANQSGTCTGELIRYALNGLDALPQSHMVLVIFTDGRPTDEDAFSAAVSENESLGIAVRICPFVVGGADVEDMASLGAPQRLEDWSIGYTDEPSEDTDPDTLPPAAPGDEPPPLTLRERLEVEAARPEHATPKLGGEPVDDDGKLIETPKRGKRR
jgi:hypothetical protein